MVKIFFQKMVWSRDFYFEFLYQKRENFNPDFSSYSAKIWFNYLGKLLSRQQI